MPEKGAEYFDERHEERQKEVNSGTLTKFRTCETPEMRNLYLYIFTFFSYNQECMKTNPKLHFEKLLDEQGLKLTALSPGTTSPPMFSDKEGKAMRLKKFQKYLPLQREADSYAKEYPGNDAQRRAKNKEIAESYDNEKSMVSTVNGLLKLPFSNIEEHAELFIFPSKLRRHFNMSSYLSNTEEALFQEIDAKDEFKFVKILSESNKIRLFKKMQKEFGIEVSMLDPTVPGHHQQLWAELKGAWTWRSNRTYDFSTKEGVKGVMKSFGTELFGHDFYKIHEVERIKCSNGKKKDTRKNHYEYNEEHVHATRHLRSYRKRKLRNVSIFVDDSDDFPMQPSQWSRDLDRTPGARADDEDSATDSDE
jgi:hypothetical protein